MTEAIHSLTCPLVQAEFVPSIVVYPGGDIHRSISGGKKDDKAGWDASGRLDVRL
jgi:hypothetical protein